MRDNTPLSDDFKKKIMKLGIIMLEQFRDDLTSQTCSDWPFETTVLDSLTPNEKYFLKRVGDYYCDDEANITEEFGPDYYSGGAISESVLGVMKCMLEEMEKEGISYSDEKENETEGFTFPFSNPVLRDVTPKVIGDISKRICKVIELNDLEYYKQFMLANEDDSNVYQRVQKRDMGDVEIIGDGYGYCCCILVSGWRTSKYIIFQSNIEVVPMDTTVNVSLKLEELK